MTLTAIVEVALAAVPSFLNRPGFVRLTALRPRPPFQVLIMSDESRLGAVRRLLSLPSISARNDGQNQS